jgi:hypothetical protein
VKSSLEVYTHNLLTLAEELLALSLMEFFPNGTTIAEIPENERDPSNPKRYRTALTAKFEYKDNQEPYPI